MSDSDSAAGRAAQRPRSRFARHVPEVVIAASGLACLGAAAYVARHHAEYLWSTAGAIVCLGVPLVVCLGLLASLRASREVRLQVFAVALSIAVALYAFEGYVTSQLSASAASLRPKPGEVAPPTRFDAVKALRAEGRDAQPLSSGVTVYAMQGGGMKEADITAGGASILPIGGISKVPVVMCNEAGPWVVYESDRYGFRNPDAAWDEGQLDVAVVGDSFAQGLCVGDDDSFAAVIRRRWPRTLDVAMGGFGPLLELASIKEYLPERRPRVVLWFFFENDFENLTRELRQPILQRYLDEPGFRQGLMAVQPEIDAGHRRIVEKAMLARDDAGGETSSVVELSAGGFAALTQVRDRLQKSYHRPTLTKELAGLGRTLKEAQRVVKGWGGELVVVLLPDYATLASRTEWGPKQGLSRVLSGLSIPLFDATPALAAHPILNELYPLERQSLLLIAPGHYNEKGHRLVGDAVVRWVEEGGYLGEAAKGP